MSYIVIVNLIYSNLIYAVNAGGGSDFMVPYRGADPVQRVPETPALQRTLAAHHKTPLSEDCRLDFSCELQ